MGDTSSGSTAAHGTVSPSLASWELGAGDSEGVDGSDLRWRPDVATLEWALSIVDHDLVGGYVLSERSRWQARDGSISPPVLGESAAESVLMPLIERALRAQGAPDGTEP